MIAKCVGSGLKQAASRPGLATTLWLWNFLLAAVVALPAWAVFRGAFSLSPEADQLLNGFNLRLLIEAFHYDRSSVPTALLATAAAVALLGLLGNALIAGGVFEILVTDDKRSFLHRFWRGAGHFFGRFLRLLILCGITLTVMAVPTVLAALAITWVMSRSDSEATRFFGYLAAPAGVFVVLAFCALVLDYARARMALDNSRSAFKAWFRSLGFVLRHLVGTAGIAIVFFILTLALFIVSVRYQTSARSNTGGLILALFLVQQATLFLRSALRVGSLAGALTFYRARGPRAAGMGQAGPESQAGGVVIDPVRAGEAMQATPADASADVPPDEPPDPSAERPETSAPGSVDKPTGA
jgi:hypothetical protein